MREISVRGARSLAVGGRGQDPGKAVCVQRKHALLFATPMQPRPANTRLRTVRWCALSRPRAPLCSPS